MLLRVNKLSTIKNSKVSVHIDGASRGNPGPAAIGAVFTGGDGEVIKSLSVKIGMTTNNVAEYSALIFALQEALMLRVKEIKVFTDSELMAKQFSGEYRVKEETIRLLFLLAQNLKRGFKKFELSHVPREQNKLADCQANKALDQEVFL